MTACSFHVCKILSPHVRSVIEDWDSGFYTTDSRIPSKGFRTPCRWKLDSGLQSLAGLQIHWARFRIPKPRTPNSTRRNFHIPDSMTQSLARVFWESWSFCSNKSQRFRDFLSPVTSTQIPNQSRKLQHKQTTQNKQAKTEELERNYKMFANPVRNVNVNPSLPWWCTKKSLFRFRLNDKTVHSNFNILF